MNPTNTSTNLFHFYTVDDLRTLLPGRWLIEQILEQPAVGCLFGPSGGGKTFVALDLLLSVVTGQSWHGHTVTQGTGIYVVAEGSRGILKRVQAWQRHHHRQTVSNAFFLLEAVQLRPRDQVRRLLRTIMAEGLTPALIVFDTFAQCFVGGEENSAKDVGEAVAAVRWLSNETGATVLMAHHSGRANLGTERGSSALRGNVDVMLSVQTTPAGAVTIKNTKQKDQPLFDDITVKLQPVSVGEEESSCVLVSGERAAVPRSRPTANDSEQQALRVLVEHGDVGLKAGDWRTAIGHARQCTVAQRTFDHWRRSLLNQGLIEAVPGKRYHYRVCRTV